MLYYLEYDKILLQCVSFTKIYRMPSSYQARDNSSSYYIIYNVCKWMFGLEPEFSYLG